MMTSYSVVSLTFIGISMIATCLLILLGNILIIVIYKRNKSLQIAPNYFILSLAVADIIIGTIGVGSYTLILLVGKWPFNYTSCIVWLSIDHWSCTASAWTVMAIASDRFLAICYPIKRRNLQTKKNVKLVIGAIWLVTFLIWVPLIVTYSYIGEGTNLPGDDCYVQFFSRNAWITLFTALCSYYLPLLVIIALYTAIIMRLIQRSRQKECRSASTTLIINAHPDSPPTVPDQISMVSQSSVSNSVISIMEIVEQLPDDTVEKNNRVKVADCHIQKLSDGEINIGEMKNNLESNLDGKVTNVNKKPLQRKNSQQHSSQHATSRGVKLLLFVTVTFAITWMPYYIMCLLLSLDVNRSDIPLSVWQFCYIFGWLNSLLNPLCYAFGNKKFKKGFKDILCSCITTSDSQSTL